MKSAIHPNWFNDATVSCACGNTFTTGSTQPQIKLDICAKCHPFYTGQQKFVDTLGQVERFKKKEELYSQKSAVKRQVLDARAQKVQAQKGDKPTLKDLLMQARKQIHS